MNKENSRKYGMSPYSVVVVHGGPGAFGEMKPVAEELSKEFGVLEPLQTKDSVIGQVEELRQQISENTEIPVKLIGYSWGAWLVFILASKYPDLVKKLILVSSGPFESKYAKEIKHTRMSRLNFEDKNRVEKLILQMQTGDTNDTTLEEFGSILAKADAYDPIGHKVGADGINLEIYQKVWPEAEELRLNGKLLEYGKDIKCPVAAIHGDYDPHPAEGVKKPLENMLKVFRFILLKDCGHTPWKEKQANDKFYKILRSELK
jgi:pimeloyl-ACP methyl ester carboxylesterase